MNYPNRIRYTFLVGISVFVALIWIDDIFDIPSLLFGVEADTLKWVAALWETILLALIVSVCLLMVRRVERRIEYLEGLNVICSHCRKVKLDDHWLPIEQWLAQTSKIEFSHGLCNQCLKELYPDRYDKVLETSELDLHNINHPRE